MPGKLFDIPIIFFKYLILSESVGGVFYFFFAHPSIPVSLGYYEILSFVSVVCGTLQWNNNYKTFNNF